jgi:hypothetical protein
MQDAQQTRTAIFWNCWVLLAMPAVWLGWSMIFFITSILCFVWRTGGSNGPIDRLPSTRESLAARSVITCTLGIGFLYFVLILHTFRKYGSVDPVNVSGSKLGTRRRDGQNAANLDRAEEGQHQGEVRRGRDQTRGSRATLENPASERRHVYKQSDTLTGKGLKDHVDIEKEDMFIPLSNMTH